MIPHRLLIVGASARAAAQSAVRYGCSVTAIDLFADLDLRESANSIRVADYPTGIADAAHGISADGFLYTGGLENHPAIVDTLSARIPLFGNSAAALVRARDPWFLADVLKDAGVGVPELRHYGEELNSNHRWLKKALRSSGGRGVAWAEHRLASRNTERAAHQQNSNDPPASSAAGEYYVQQFIEGTSCSGVFLAARGRCQLLGVTRQLIGQPWCRAGGFEYCGSIGPVALENATLAQLNSVGQALTSGCGLVGIFGVDFIAAEGQVWPVEVNPRYPASAELIERASGVSVVGLHLEACLGDVRNDGAHATCAGCHGKAVLFSRRDSCVPRSFPLAAKRMGKGLLWPTVADVPEEGTRLSSGWPIVTVFAHGQTEAQVEAGLRARAAAVEDMIEQGGASTGIGPVCD